MVKGVRFKPAFNRDSRVRIPFLIMICKVCKKLVFGTWCNTCNISCTDTIRIQITGKRQETAEMIPIEQVTTQKCEKCNEFMYVYHLRNRAADEGETEVMYCKKCSAVNKSNT